MEYNESDFSGLTELVPLIKLPDCTYDQHSTYAFFEALNDLLNYLYSL